MYCQAATLRIPGAFVYSTGDEPAQLHYCRVLAAKEFEGPGFPRLSERRRSIVVSGRAPAVQTPGTRPANTVHAPCKHRARTMRTPCKQCARTKHGACQVGGVERGSRRGEGPEANFSADLKGRRERRWRAAYERRASVYKAEAHNLLLRAVEEVRQTHRVTASVA